MNDKTLFGLILVLVLSVMGIFFYCLENVPVSYTPPETLEVNPSSAQVVAMGIWRVR